MKALVLREALGPSSALLTDMPVPEPGPGELRVAIRAAALNQREIWISFGQYPHMSLPSILGADGAGIVDAVGDGVDAGMIGREVVLYPARDWGSNEAFPSKDFRLLGMPLPGTIAEFICVPADLVLMKPRAFSFEQAAAFPTAGLTAWRALTRIAKLQAGEKVLITGIGGGVATFALRFAVSLGANVFVTSSSDSNLARATELGARDGFNYTSPNWDKAMRKEVGGFDVIIDGAPAASYRSYSRALNLGARIVVYGSTRGVEFAANAPDLFLRHASILGTAMGSVADFREMFDHASTNNLTPVIDSVFKLEQVNEAMSVLEKAHFGKVVVVV